MKILLVISLLIIIVVLFPAGILLSLLARKLSQSGRSLWAYCKVLLLTSLAVFLSVYLTNFHVFKNYLSIPLMLFSLGLMLALIVWLYQRGWNLYEKIASVFWGLLVFSVVIFLSFHYSIFYPFVIADTGMAPVYNKGDLVFCQMNRGLTGNYSKGDVVILKSPIDSTKTIIRKIIAVNGDSVKINAGQLLVNDQIIRKVQANELIAPIVLGEGQYFVFAEKTDNTVDSKMFGPIISADIHTEVLFRVNWLKKLGNQ